MAFISRSLLPTIVGISVYIIINKFFPETVEVFQTDSKYVRGGSQTKMFLAKRIAKKLLKDKALKLAILSVFATAGIQYFQSEIEALLIKTFPSTVPT